MIFSGAALYYIYRIVTVPSSTDIDFVVWNVGFYKLRVPARALHSLLYIQVS